MEVGGGSYADRVRVYFDDECVADHRRLFGRDQTVFDPWHYLPVLQRKPGALRNGAPFKDWALPAAIKRTLERLKSYRDWDRQSVDILSMVPVYGWETVAEVCDQALLSGSVTRDRVLNLLSRANEEEVPEPMETPAHLQLREPPLADCARYDRFRRQEHWSYPGLVDTSTLSRGGDMMPRSHAPYPPEFRRQMLELVRVGRPPRELAREFGCCDQTIRHWIRQSERDEGVREEGLSSDEREELRRLRRENRQLREEREILKKAAAWFAGETGAVPGKSSGS